jgi:hypothetical protein
VNVKDAIGSLISAAQGLQRVSFKDVVEVTSKHKLYPVNPQLQEDNELIESLTASCQHFVAFTNKTGTRFRGERINDVSRPIENVLVEEIRKIGLRTRILSETGYPDIELTDKYDRITYLEVKISSKKKPSSLRTFYYTSGKKIQSDARHLLLGLLFSEERDKYWKLEEWILTDLSKLFVNLKAEFNASNIDIYTDESVLAKSP